ncbi:MAG: glycosyltransferase [Anaerolineaceae bacterium]
MTVLIAEYNAATRIQSTLEHLLSCSKVDSLDWELLIVDNNSSDETLSIAQTVWNSEVPLRIVHESKQGVGFARYTGLLEARYEYVATVDDDNWVYPDWMKKVVDYMDATPRAAVIAGRGYPVYESNPPAWFERYQQNYGVGRQYDQNGLVQDPYRLFYGAGCVARKSAFLDLVENGFNTIMPARSKNGLLAGEESEHQILYRLRGWEIHYQDDICFQHFMPSSRLSWNYFKRLRQGFGASAVYLDLYREVYKSHLTGVRSKRVVWRALARKSFLSLIKDPLAIIASGLPKYASNHRVATYLAKLGGFKTRMTLKGDIERIHEKMIDWIETLPSPQDVIDSTIPPQTP